MKPQWKLVGFFAAAAVFAAACSTDRSTAPRAGALNGPSFVKGGTQSALCPSYAPTGTDKIDITDQTFPITVTAPPGYVIDFICLKAGTTIFLKFFDPLTNSIEIGADVAGLDGKGLSHYSVHWILEEQHESEGQWCSPGFWRNNANNFGAQAWPVATTTKYNGIPLSPAVAGNPSLLQVLNAPQVYGGAAFNAVGTYLSQQAELNVQFDENGNPIHNCPISQQDVYPDYLDPI